MGQYFSSKTLLIIIVLNSIWGFGLYEYYLGSVIRSKNSLLGELSAKDSRLNTLQGLSEEIGEYETKIKGYEKRIVDNFYRILPDASVGKFFSLLIARAGRLNLRISQLTPGKSEEWPLPSGKQNQNQAGGSFSFSSSDNATSPSKKKKKSMDEMKYFAHPLLVKLTGDVEKVHSFVRWLEEIPPFILVDRIHFTKALKNYGIEIQLDLVIFSFQADLSKFQEKKFISRKLKEKIELVISKSLTESGKLKPADPKLLIKNSLRPYYSRRRTTASLEDKTEEDDFEDDIYPENQFTQKDTSGFDAQKLMEVLKLEGVIINKREAGKSQVSINDREYGVGDSFLLGEYITGDQRQIRIINIQKEVVVVEAEGKEYRLFVGEEREQ